MSAATGILDLRRLRFAGEGDGFMDRLTLNMLGSFSKEYGIEDLPEDKRFEHFCAFSTVRRHYNRTFDPSDIVVGQGGDTGIDAIAIVVNGLLVTDVDTIAELAEQNGYIEATFIFVQAERSTGFSAATIGDFSFGVRDFFEVTPKLQRNENVTEAATVMAAVYERSGIFRQRPSCVLYYVTTGSWKNDAQLVARRDAAIEELKGSSNLS